jgi:hypothetical protein
MVHSWIPETRLPLVNYRRELIDDGPDFLFLLFSFFSFPFFPFFPSLRSCRKLLPAGCKLVIASLEGLGGFVVMIFCRCLILLSSL